MAVIMRAGPFASSSDSFLDEPSPTASIVPVNCAMSDWVNDSWQCFQRFDDQTGSNLSYIDGPSVSKSLTFGGTGGGEVVSIDFSFRYHAAIETTMDVVFSLSAVGADPVLDPANVSASVVVDGVTEFSGGDSGETPSFSASPTITLKESVLPVLVEVSCQSSNGAFGVGNAVALASIEP